MEKFSYNSFGILGILFRLVDDYPIISNIAIAMELLAIAWAALTYNFTTNF